jgi:CRP/FNR family transcriptional regulator, cyclic AMP receptor protein
MISKPTWATPSYSLRELLEHSAWFPLLDEAARREVLHTASEREVANDGVVSRYGEVAICWYGVLAGLLKWSITARDGNSITLGGQSPGSWFGEGALLRGQPRQADIIALRPSRVAMIPKQTFESLHRTQLAFNHFLLGQINERLHWFMTSITARHLIDADGQVALALVGLLHPLLNPAGGNHLLISQEEIANLAGLSRPRCNRALSRFKERGWIEVEYSSITIRDLPALRRLAT